MAPAAGLAGVDEGDDRGDVVRRSVGAHGPQPRSLRFPGDCRDPRDPLSRRRRRAGWSRASTSTNLRDAGDPVELAGAYDAEGADELTFLDVTAVSGDRETTLDVVRRTAEQVFIPLTVGGGVRSADDVDAAAARRRRQGGRQHRGDRPPELISEIAERFGAQVLVLSVDARRVADGDAAPRASRSPRTAAARGTGIDAVEWARRGGRARAPARSC